MSAEAPPLARSEKREIFAALVLAGLCGGMRWQPGYLVHAKEAAADAVALADALLEALGL